MITDRVWHLLADGVGLVLVEIRDGDGGRVCLGANRFGLTGFSVLSTV